MKLSAGAVVPAISVPSIHGKPVRIPDPSARYVHLQFLRFAGCPMCNFHLHTLSKRAAELAAAGIHEVVVFHASRAEMLKYQADLPFDCIADPDRTLYRQFGVEPSLLSLLHPAAVWAGLRGILATGKFSAKAENGPFGLPADFLIGPDGAIVAAHYGGHASDSWDADVLLRLAD